MDLTPTFDQQQLLEGAVAILRRTLPVSRLHGDESARFPSRSLTAEQGWNVLGLPESAGGLGLGAVDEMLLLRELGRYLGPTHVLANLIAGHVSIAAGNSALASAFAASELAAGLAVADGVTERDGDGLRGPARLYDCHDATHYVLVADGTAWLFEAPQARPALRPCLDKSISMAAIELGGLRPVAEARDRTIGDRLLLLVAAMLEGGAEAAMTMVTEYAKIRETFGRKIGSYQAVRHPIAEMAVRCEQAKALLFYAALAVDEGRSDAGGHASAAYVLASRIALANADGNIQLHGGIGLTDEMDAHFYLKRAHVLSRWCGLASAHLDRVIATELCPL